MLIKSLISSSLLLLSFSNCFAECVYDPIVSTAPYPIALSLPISNPVIIRADAPANSLVPLLNGDFLQSTQNTGAVSLINCVKGVDPFGNSSSLNPLSNDLNANYQTNIDGLAIRAYNVIVQNDGYENEGGFPGRPNRVVPAERITDYNVFMRIRLYKTREHLNLKNPNGDVLINATPMAFFRWYTRQTKPFWFLDLPEIRIVSTPVCTVSEPGEINFNQVSKENLEHGVTRNIQFGLNCITDYNNYSASASIQSTSATADGDFIKVTDNAGNTDRMKIRISDSNGQVMKVDGSTSDKQATAITSNTTTNFAWKATLLPVAGANTPELGDFTANAEIVIQVN